MDPLPTPNRAVANSLVSTVSLFVREGSSNIFQSIWFALLFGGPLVAISQDEMQVNSAHLPRPVTTNNFTALKSESPFLRTVGLSKSLVMTGIATIEDDLYATLIDLETKESFLVSEGANDVGLQLVAMDGDVDDLETLTAQIKIEGNQVVPISHRQRSSKNCHGCLFRPVRTSIAKCYNFATKGLVRMHVKRSTSRKSTMLRDAGDHW